MCKFYFFLLICLFLNTNASGVDMKIIISSEDKVYSTLVDNITTEGAAITQLPKVSAYCLQALNNSGKMIGGLAGYEFYGSFIVDVLWIDPEHRKQGIGSLLLKKLEEFGKEKKLKFLSVTSMGWWNALPFYEKNGFEIEFIREGFENNYRQYQLIKNLTP
jgi:ribosomal protein S18 acetylase RimI-like enzyme